MANPIGKIIEYVHKRKFEKYLSNKDGKVFFYQLDPKLHLYLYYHYDQCELIYDNDFYNLLYSGSPYSEEFPIVLDHALFERDRPK